MNLKMKYDSDLRIHKAEDDNYFYFVTDIKTIDSWKYVFTQRKKGWKTFSKELKQKFDNENIFIATTKKECLDYAKQYFKKINQGENNEKTNSDLQG